MLVQLEASTLSEPPPIHKSNFKSQHKEVVSNKLLDVSSEELWQYLLTDNGKEEVHVDHTFVFDELMDVDANDATVNYDQNNTLPYPTNHIEENNSPIFKKMVLEYWS